tara:strand:+ start:330 stop:650 length:321 start_codon:yes stop_codon:yes gene_type:complete
MDLSPIERQLSILHTSKFASSVMTLLIVLYSGLARPELPKSIRKLFNNAVFRVLVLALVVYRGNKDPQFAIMLAVGFVITMNLISEQELKEKFRNNLPQLKNRRRK